MSEKKPWFEVYVKFTDNLSEPERHDHLLYENGDLDDIMEKVWELLAQKPKIYEVTILIDWDREQDG